MGVGIGVDNESGWDRSAVPSHGEDDTVIVVADGAKWCNCGCACGSG